MTKKKISKERHIKRLEALKALQSAIGLTQPGQSAITDPVAPIRDQKSHPILISIDIEYWEHDSGCITEIGISILDSTLLPEGFTPGDRGKNYWEYIYSEHIRIKETLKLTNHQFVAGCPENFDFGTSTILTSFEAPDYILKLFRSTTLDGTRPLYLVGHDVKGDGTMLSRFIEFELDCISSEFLVIDSQNLWPLLYDDSTGPSLAKTLIGLNIEYRHLHNAGNDALYALWVCIGIAVTIKEPLKMAFKQRELLCHFLQVPGIDDAITAEKDGW